MNYNVTSGTINIKDDLGITYSVCDIEYILYDNDTYKFIFTPNYSVIGLTNSKFFQGIPGLDLDLEEKEYIRENIMPVFISERCPMKNRENLYDELNEAGLDYNNPIQWLINTKYKYSGDNFFVEKKVNKKTVVLKDEDFKKNINLNLKELLDYICKGYNVVIEDIEINDSNRKSMHTILSKLYYNTYYFHKKKINKVGRKNKEIDPLLLNEIIGLYKNKKISVEDAYTKLEVSRSTFFRLLSKYQKESF